MDPVSMPMDSSWGGEIHFMCFNDECSYFVNSWKSLEEQGIEGTGYRCRMDPRGACGPAAVWSRDALKHLIVCDEEAATCVPETSDFFAVQDFAREDETPDSVFYADRSTDIHLDSTALATIEDLYAQLIPKGARVLDLFAGTDSHVRAEVEPATLVGVGLNQDELDANPLLTERIVHDANEQPSLPFGDDEFDVAVCSMSVDYLTKPIELFHDVGRVLRPGGRFIVVFSNRMFPPKAVDIWKKTNEAERPGLVRQYFTLSGAFGVEGRTESTGKPRPQDDQYYSLGIPSDPIYAVWGRVVN
jgi:SAM-dependent methyltransferase